MLILDRKHKPARWPMRRYGCAVDCRWSHRDLVVAWPFWDPATSVYGLAGGATPTAKPLDPINRGVFDTSFAFWNPGRRGTSALQFAATGNGIGTKRELPTGPCTLVMHYHKLDATFRVSGAVGYESTMSTDTARLGVHLPYSDGTVYWDYGGTAAGTTRLSVGGLTFGDDIWVFTTGPRGMEIWQNGFKRASNSANPTRTADQTKFWGLFHHGTTQSDYAESAGLLLYSRQLSEWEIYALTEDIWTPFRPPASVARKSIASLVSPDSFLKVEFRHV